MKVSYVPVEAVNRVWPTVEHFIADALSHSHGEYNAEHAKVYVTTGAWKLLVATDEEGDVRGACTVEMFNRPNDRVAFITATGGRLISSTDTFKQLGDVLKHFGATKIEGAARESVARLWRRHGFAEKYRIVEVSL